MTPMSADSLKSDVSPPGASTVPLSSDEALQRAFSFHKAGNLTEAERYCRACLDARPGDFIALHLLGLVQAQQGRFDDADHILAKALEINPRSAEACANHASVLMTLGRFEGALAGYDKALTIRPDFAEALGNRGFALHQLKRYEEALASYQRALTIKPEFDEALNNRGNALQQLLRYDEALASYDMALSIRPGYAEAWCNRGFSLLHLRRYDEALASYDKALAINPGFVEALRNRGLTLEKLRRHDAALASYDRALAIQPGHAETLYNRGSALHGLQRYDEALASFDKALTIEPGDAAVLNDRANTLRVLERHEEAIACYAQLLEQSPDFPFAKGEQLHAKMMVCDWSGFASLAESVRSDVAARKKAAGPFGFQAVSASPRELQRCAETYVAERFPPISPPLFNGQRSANARIRLGYVSGEFRNQATSVLMAELFELHDRDRFEICAFDSGFDDRSEIRRRIEAAFGEIVDISKLSDREAATLIYSRGIDILVNLNGYFGRVRQGVFSHRPCPVQVNYLGFPGTLGAPYIDYIIADPIVIPPTDCAFYTEKVVHLPDTYQVNDRKRRIAATTPTRAGNGLPEEGIVFCCFNNNYKITPVMFDVWMRLLARVPRSVLWLLADNPAAARNLRREAQARGVAAERLVFAQRIRLDLHLARHRLADLFVDSLPYNAHTTASDALWAGLPVLTCAGGSFAGRVAASLLHAVGLPELVTNTLEEYEDLALRLARQPPLLAEIRQKLLRNLDRCPLFDTARFRRHIEAAYVEMWERFRRGEAPGRFDVHSMDARDVTQ